MTTKDEVREGTEPREEKCVCGEQTTFGGADVEIGGVCHRVNNPCYIIEPALPREDAGKEFWAKFDLDKWLEDAKEVGEILRKSMEREVRFIKVNPDDFKNLEWKTTNPDEEAALPKKEGEGWDRQLEALFNQAVSAVAQYIRGEISEEERTARLKELDEKGKDFIRQHFISRTAVEKIIGELQLPEPTSNMDDNFPKNSIYNLALRDLKEKINKG